MRLADFILRDMEAILVAWEAFASVQLPAARHMKPLALRDHAARINRLLSEYCDALEECIYVLYPYLAKRL
jgi:hypothetical protein